MNKEDLVSKIVGDAAITKASTEKALKSITDSVSQTLAKGENLTLIGFGTFTVGESSPQGQKSLNRKGNKHSRQQSPQVQTRQGT